jgi:hypothetical protein
MVRFGRRISECHDSWLHIIESVDRSHALATLPDGPSDSAVEEHFALIAKPVNVLLAHLYGRLREQSALRQGMRRVHASWRSVVLGPPR